MKDESYESQLAAMRLGLEAMYQAVLYTKEIPEGCPCCTGKGGKDPENHEPCCVVGQAFSVDGGKVLLETWTKERALLREAVQFCVTHKEERFTIEHRSHTGDFEIYGPKGRFEGKFFLSALEAYDAILAL